MFEHSQHHMHRRANSSYGFSLVEMAIVLVVVGIVAAGVMIGQQLLERSKYNKVVSDVSNYSRTVLEFQRTYGGLPGDLSNASVYFPSLTTADNGNGNGVIDGGEDQLFWIHLRASGLLKEGIPAIAAGVTNPKSSLDGLGYSATEDPALGVVMELTSFNAGVGGFAAMTPEQVMQLEASDDGNPMTGKIRAAEGNGIAAGDCVASSVAGAITSYSYNTANAAKACIIRFVAKDIASNTPGEVATESACGIVGTTRSTGVSCPTGYSGEITETCTADGTWQTSNNGCQIVNCSGGVYQDVRTVGCGPGYSGEITQECSSGGVWTTSASTCAPIYGACPTPGDTKTLACPEGQAGGVYLSCSVGNVWTETSNTCTSIKCGTNEIGETRTAACPTGYTGSQVEVCSANGSWLPKDLNSTCILSNGETCTVDGDTRSLNCPAGKSGAVEQQCQMVGGSQVWVTTSNSCSVIMCGGTPVGYSRDSQTLCPGSTNVYKQEICGSDGQWQISDINCPQLSPCSLPWGGSIANGSSVNAFSVASVVSPSTCPAATTRNCNDGVLDGSGDYGSCSVIVSMDCTLPWGGTLTNGASVSAYAASTGTPCPAPVTRTCTNGVLSGTGNYASCASNCTLPWGGTIASGASVSAYSVSSGAPCPAPVTRTCTNGTLSGSGNFGSCLSSCLLPWGGYLAHGSSVNAYAYQYSQPTVNSCPAPVVRTCTNGTLSGSGNYASCAVAQSCADLRDSGYSYTANGVYKVNPNSSGNIDVYCNMTADGGGWTLVVAQYESNPATNWNEGKQADYDPTLATAKSIALSSTQIGPHNSIAFGKNLSPTFVDWAPKAYSTGNIAKDLLYSIKTGFFYHIHRNSAAYYGSHDPESGAGSDVNWNNTLTFDKTGGVGYNWAFAPNGSTPQIRGATMAGAGTTGTSDAYAWTMWTNRRNDVYASCAAVKANALNTASGQYIINDMGYVNCDISSSNGAFTDCGDAKTKGMTTSGKYMIDPDGAGGATAPFVTYCDQTHDGGGWTMVAAQFESTPQTNWDAGVSTNYDPALGIDYSFVLNSAQLPSHNQVAFGKGLNATFVDYAPFTYSTGNLAKTLVRSSKTGFFYHIHRNSAAYYGSHDPESGAGSDVNWNNTLTFDKTGGVGYNWAFAPNGSTPQIRGATMAGAGTTGTSESYAWTVWVRTKPVYNNCAAVKAAGQTVSTTYELKNFGNVYCDMSSATGSFTSCSDALAKGMSTNDRYSLDPDGAGGTAAYIGYCNQTADGGGWQLVAAQFESGPLGWDNGVSGYNYDPTLTIGDSYVLNSAQIPSHNEVGFGKNLTAPTFVDRIPFVYSTGNIAKKLVTSRKTDTSYHIHRNSAAYYGSHDPESGSGSDVNWNNTLTLDAVGGVNYNWAFAPNGSTPQIRGATMAGAGTTGTSESYAWTIWVRTRSDIYASCAAAKSAGNTISGQYDINIHGSVYCDMSQASGVFSSCQDAKTKGMNSNGRYMIDPDGAGGNAAFVAYCNQTTDGGGWTLIVAQYESNPVAWTGGLNNSYEPTLTSKVSFAFDTTNIPAHTNIGFGKNLNPTFVDWVPGTYSTGNIAKTLRTSSKTGFSYHIHRNSAAYYGSHDPESGSGSDVNWNNTLTFDKTGGIGYNWAFAPNGSTPQIRGATMAGVGTTGTSDAYAWTVWVR